MLLTNPAIWFVVEPESPPSWPLVRLVISFLRASYGKSAYNSSGCLAGIVLAPLALFTGHALLGLIMVFLGIAGFVAMWWAY